MNNKEIMQARNRWVRRVTSAGMAVSVLMLTGCGCWPFSETTRYETEWKSQTVGALFRDADRTGDVCRDALYTQHLKDAVSACKDGAYEKIRNRISGEPVRLSLAKATCAEAQAQLDQGIPANIQDRIFNLNPFPDEFTACMSEKGFKREEVEKKACYVKFM
ncbi:hypothetical protein [Burkholderia cenocepacia]|jgi:hypothetical protein|nr:hypothetical protein [Burkholderia cenocepacia]EPZ87871.1 putative lipoprotein [Burkholderia cenocepacia K56-2Valvano]ERI28635.1 putative lipoprotein [Burkholderia cenocepacia BC7]MBJ9900322.1 hypothetical protein [Burkholderia cenocepacia]MBJ9916719.1 hypothetical protein [Burkholderia cenocepacia]MBR8117262.1 hypothetical protein [Burkholderia cenocepacia]